LKLYVVGMGKPSIGITYVQPTSIPDFLSLIFYANYVFTGSYHGMLFSIYFGRQFSFFNRAHKSRMNTIAHKFHLENRENGIGDNAINYEEVGPLVSSFREKSLTVLKEMLAH